MFSLKWLVKSEILTRIQNPFKCLIHYDIILNVLELLAIDHKQANFCRTNT